MSTNALPTTPLLQEDRSTAPLSGWRKTIADTLLVGSSTLACQALGVVTSLAMRALLDPAAMGIWQGLKTFLSYANYTNLGISKGATQELAVARGREHSGATQRGVVVYEAAPARHVALPVAVGAAEEDRAVGVLVEAHVVVERPAVPER